MTSEAVIDVKSQNRYEIPGSTELGALINFDANKIAENGVVSSLIFGTFEFKPKWFQDYSQHLKKFMKEAEDEIFVKKTVNLPPVIRKTVESNKSKYIKNCLIIEYAMYKLSNWLKDHSFKEMQNQVINREDEEKQAKLNVGVDSMDQIDEIESKEAAINELESANSEFERTDQNITKTFVYSPQSKRDLNKTKSTLLSNIVSKNQNNDKKSQTLVENKNKGKIVTFEIEKFGQLSLVYSDVVESDGLLVLINDNSVDRFTAGGYVPPQSNDENGPIPIAVMVQYNPTMKKVYLCYYSGIKFEYNNIEFLVLFYDREELIKD